MRAIDDWVACLNGDTIPSDGRKITRAERRELLNQTSEWLFGGEDDGVGSLSYCCAVLGLNADAVRERLRRTDVKTRRHHLTDAEIAEALRLFRSGWSTLQLSARFGVGDSAFRKLRLRAERDGRLKYRPRPTSGPRRMAG